MERFIFFADKVSAWFGKGFAWCIMVMAFGVGYEVFVRYLLRDPTSWAFDLSYMMYGALFMMAGAYTLSRDGHVRGDFVYRLWKPKIQALVELILYFIFFFPGVIALILAGWKYTARSWRYLEVSVMSPANVPIFQFKTVINTILSFCVSKINIRGHGMDMAIIDIVKYYFRYSVPVEIASGIPYYSYRRDPTGVVIGITIRSIPIDRRLRSEFIPLIVLTDDQFRMPECALDYLDQNQYISNMEIHAHVQPASSGAVAAENRLTAIPAIRSTLKSPPPRPRRTPCDRVRRPWPGTARRPRRRSARYRCVRPPAA